MDISIGGLILIGIVIWFLMQIVLGVLDGMRVLEVREHVEKIQRIKDLIHEVKVEKIGEVEYWFDKDNDAFLGQGKNVDEIVSHVKSRFPDHIFLIQNLGGVSKQTDWKLLDMEEFKKLKLKLEDI